ncbi:hypothetical protein Lal_00049936 [Lupinus albus]|uniref:Uncharacterized protein n=1 Tax=Lupinus albus TaxID=3870 RepID=A0A6A4PLS4_LUPAL|nr:hypothetical protein Lalb_Chr12g0200571 [Lupinus albus]KAF1867507.1 hypothetical protein Lal_00049936 [Lupinus albus]
MAWRVVLVIVMLVFSMKCMCSSVGHMPSTKEEGRDYKEVKAKTSETAKKGKEAIESWTEWAKEKLNEGLGLKNDEDHKDSTIKKASDYASDAAKKTKEYASSAGEKAKDYGGSAAHKSREYAGDAAQRTKEKVQDVASGTEKVNDEASEKERESKAKEGYDTAMDSITSNLEEASKQKSHIKDRLGEQHRDAEL